MKEKGDVITLLAADDETLLFLEALEGKGVEESQRRGIIWVR